MIRIRTGQLSVITEVTTAEDDATRDDGKSKDDGKIYLLVGDSRATLNHFQKQIYGLNAPGEAASEGGVDDRGALC